MKKIIILITILTLSSIALADIPADCDSSTLAYWKLDDTTDPNVIDYYDDNNGTNSGATRGVSGKVLDAFDFNGVNEFATLPNLGKLTTGTVEFWFNPDDDYNSTMSNRGYLVLSDQPLWQDVDTLISITFGNTCGTNNGKLLFETHGPTVGEKNCLWSNKNNWDNGTWYHIAVTWDGTDKKIYIDGQPDNSVAYTGDVFGAGLISLSYRSATGNYFDGKMDEVAFYNTALSDTEIQIHYENSLAGYDYCDISGPAFGYPIPEFSSIGFILIAVIFALLMVYRSKKK